MGHGVVFLVGLALLIVAAFWYDGRVADERTRDIDATGSPSAGSLAVSSVNDGDAELTSRRSHTLATR